MTDSESIPPDKIKCFITGKLRNNTPEEQVRQVVARSLVEEYGYNKKDIEIEFSIKMGSKRKAVDIAIFYESKEHTQANIYIICETKREDVKPYDKDEGVKQLFSYMSACLNATFGLWVGDERLAFNSKSVNGERELVEVPDIPKHGESSVPIPTRGSLVPAVSLKGVFKRVHNYIHANQGVAKDKAFEELQKLIFIKVFDEQYNPTLKFYVLPDDSGNDLRERLMTVFKKVQERYKYIFKGNEVLELNDSVLRYAVSELQRFSMIDTKTDIKGEAYEEIVGPNLRGDRGEFFTPRNVCTMVVEIIFSMIEEDVLSTPGAFKILDPAAGTGGFLIAALQKIKSIFQRRGFKYDQLRELVKDVANSNFYGMDFNPFLVKVSQMNMVMHGDGSSNIYHADSLRELTGISDQAEDVIRPGTFDVVITNPPFGTNSAIDNPNILQHYEITTYGTNSPRTKVPPEQLFVERCLYFLKDGGILGIVLPDSILSNPGLTWMRKLLLSNVKIVASIDLPVETFEPSTGTKTSVLVVKKQKQKEADYNIFMAKVEKVGHDRRGVPVFRTDPEGKVELDSQKVPIVDDDLPYVSEAFTKWYLGNSKKG